MRRVAIPALGALLVWACGSRGVVFQEADESSDSVQRGHRPAIAAGSNGSVLPGATQTSGVAAGATATPTMTPAGPGMVPAGGATTANPVMPAMGGAPMNVVGVGGAIAVGGDTGVGGQSGVLDMVACDAGRPCPRGARCNGGYCECPAFNPDLCTTGCTTLGVDPDNCGACGAICPATSACSQGECTPEPTVGYTRAQCGRVEMAVFQNVLYWIDRDAGTLQRETQLGQVPELLNDQLVDPEHLAIDDSGVYITGATHGQVVHVSYFGGPTTPVWETGSPSAAVALTAQTVLLTDGAQIIQVPKPFLGGTTSTIATPVSEGIPRALATDGASVFWATDLALNVEAAPLSSVDAVCTEDPDTSPCVTLAASQGSLVFGPNALAVLGESVYWINGSVINSTPKSGPMATTVAQALGFDPNDGFVLTPEYIYWGNAGNVERAPRGNGETESVARAQGKMTSFAATSTRVYWSTADCEILSTPL